MTDLKRAWKTACEKAKVGLLFHDLRRSANRSMRDAALLQPMRTKITGHKTASMDRRYGIVDLTDIQIARELVADKPRKASEKTARSNAPKEEGPQRKQPRRVWGWPRLFLRLGWYLIRVYYLDCSEAREPTPVECKNSSETVHLHRGHQTCIVSRLS